MVNKRVQIQEAEADLVSPSFTVDQNLTRPGGAPPAGRSATIGSTFRVPLSLFFTIQSKNKPKGLSAPLANTRFSQFYLPGN